ncbi:hypothetical protein Hypma_009128 [Hypsizygus marmoreus]|uniref:Uncharacterized protein n=1 Tax=Hypsizygus marmoreus TaxID=39966 RepID=A0A369JM79_HYPMA|nr:hypothetical protein Hypma_009128 [Hypsizygus marmoreus]
MQGLCTTWHGLTNPNETNGSLAITAATQPTSEAADRFPAPAPLIPSRAHLDEILRFFPFYRVLSALFRLLPGFLVRSDRDQFPVEFQGTPVKISYCFFL